jgi:hypothetical protein
MRTDVNFSHSKNIWEPIGHDFCGTPIRSYDKFDLELDQALDVQRTVLSNNASGIEFPSTAEILPGETLCSDNVVRRMTTAEAIGYDAYMDKKEVAMLIGTDGMMYDPETNQWGRADKLFGQSTPEEMCAWLNAQEKCSFIYTVVEQGEDKILRATDSKGVPLYAFRYVGGLPGTYIGGGEIHPFEPPQTERGAGTDSRVVECIVPTPERAYREPVVMQEWVDEGHSAYTPTLHLERLTVGGTALFDELREAIELDKATVEVEVALAQPQVCEWYPDGEHLCTEKLTHARTRQQAGTCDACFAAREACGDSVAPLGVDL